jgi:hypothetical protein
MLFFELVATLVDSEHCVPSRRPIEPAASRTGSMAVTYTVPTV